MCYETWHFDKTCPHKLDEYTHCDACCVDIGDAERAMRFELEPLKATGS